MYGRGHAEGTRKQTASQSDWYTVIAEQRIAELDAAQRQSEMEEQAMVAALAKQVGNAIVAMPEAAERIRKAAKLVQSKAVWPLSSGAYLVGSESDAKAAYLVQRHPLRCECGDFKGRQRLCKHGIAAALVIKMGAAYTPSY